MNKPTYCPHCWAEITNADTTCRQCGEAVNVVEEDGDDEPVMIHIIWLFYIIVIIGLVLGVSGK